MSAGDPARDRVSFNLDWRFQKDDAAGLGDRLSYATIKLGGCDRSGSRQPRGGEGGPAGW